MTRPAISAQKLSKRYYIGERPRYYSLRETISGSFTSSARRIFSRLTSAKPDHHHQYLWALKDVSFEINKGEVVGIIGRNGAGKSTLLKIISRITEPTAGYVEIYGRVGSLLEVGTGFHPELTGRENIYLSGAVLGMKKAEIKRKFDEIVAFAEIEKFIDTPSKHYSSGMYVRLAFAVAAHLEPEIVLVDEVLAVGDGAFKKKCLGKMGDVVQGGRTVLFVSHDMSAIRSLCGRAMWIDEGQILKSGATAEVVRSYEESQIKRFNGSSCVSERSSEDTKKLTFYVSRVEIANARGEKTNIFKYNEKLTLTVDVGGDLKAERYAVEYYLYNQLGQLVSVGSSGVYHDIYFDKKIRRVKIEIGPLLLTSGRYTISLSTLRDTSPAWRTDMWDYACSFTIMESRPFLPSRDIPSLNEGACILQQSFHAVE